MRRVYAVSPDGAYLYATGFDSNGVAVFARDTTTGLLTFAQVIKRNAGGQPPLAGARDVVVAPDGRMIFASGHDDNRVVSIPLANPTPTLTGLVPASTLAGGPAFTLTVNGQDFVKGATVVWNGANRPTTFINSGKLQAQISAADVAGAGAATITAANPAPGGGTSNAVPFVVTAPNENPVPSIAVINSQGAAAGSPAFVLTVTGANFIGASQVQWNGTNRPTMFVSATTLQVQISADDVAQSGQASVTVVNPVPGGGTSNAAGFEIAAPGENPPPAITRLVPSSVNVGSVTDEFTLVVYGTNFVEGAQAQWNGENRPTTFIDSTQVQISLSAAELSTLGSASVTIENPAPGGGLSNVATFTIGAAGDKPVPVLTGVTVGQPSLLTNSGVSITLTGDGFANGATVLWNGTSYQPTQVTPNEIIVNIPATDYRTAAISVLNPAPGGSASNDLLFKVTRVYLPLVVQ